MNRLSSLIVFAVIANSFALPNDASGQVPEGFEVVVLANDLGVHQRPGINNRSEVVWSSTFCPVTNILLYSEGRIRQISEGTMNDHWPDLNNEGMLAWKRGDDCLRPFELVVYQDGVARTIPGAPIISSIPALNDAGFIVFTEDNLGAAPNVQLFLYDGKEVRQLTDNGLSNQGARINAQGDIVWTRYDFFVSPWTSTILVNTKGKTIELTDGTGQPQSPDINDAGRVAYHQVEANQRVIKVWELGQVTTIGVGSSPRLNNKGDITFGRWNDLDEHWDIWVYSEDEFYSLPHAGFGGFKPSINDRGEVAYNIWQNDFGDTGVFLLRRIAPPGDMDYDCRADFRDFGQFQTCFTGPDNAPERGLLGDCTRADLDADGDVDRDDFVAFLAAYTGPDDLVPGCEP